MIYKILLVLMGGVMLFGCGTQSQKNSQKKGDGTNTQIKEILAVEAIVASKNSYVDTITSSAPIQGFTDVMISSRSNGTITSIQAKLGQLIKAGQLLLAVDGAVQEAGLAQAAVGVDQAQLAYDVAKQLYDKGNGSKAELIGTQTGLSAAKAGFAMAKLNADYTKTYSSVSGIVTYADPSIQPGGTIAAGMPLVRIVDISKFKQTIHLGENAISTIALGNAVSIDIPACGVTLSGRVTAIASATDPVSGTFTVEITAPNPGNGVRAGMTGVARIVTKKVIAGIMLPYSVVMERNGEAIVYRLNAKTARLVNVTFDKIGNGKVLVTSGIAVGDTIITTGLSQITDNTAVTPTIKDLQHEKGKNL